MTEQPANEASTPTVCRNRSGIKDPLEVVGFCDATDVQQARFSYKFSTSSSPSQMPQSDLAADRAASWAASPLARKGPPVLA
ncbi:MAG: hypothetical protein WBY94_06905, partial [Polyangiaceae bacterium]